jgi:transposase
MKKAGKELQPGERVFVGIDLHKNKWHVTVRTFELELFSGSIPGTWEALKSILHRYRGHRITTVYEAGYFGFWFHDRIIAYGAECIVTPPSLIPQEYDNKVKKDRRDSRKLAHFLAKSMLKAVWIPTEKERYHRQVIRRRRQLIRDRIRAQSRIKAELRLYGFNISAPHGKWTQAYLTNLGRIRFNNRFMQESFNRLLEQYYFLDDLIKKQTDLLRELAKTKHYRERVEILMTIPGVGLIAAMELLLELQDVSRFQRADQLAAYVGLTPSQYSSAEKVRMGRITCVGKNSLRAMLIQSAWTLIRKDGVMREKYERLKCRAGGKRAIVAVARTLLIRMRRLLLDGNPYVIGVM